MDQTGLTKKLKHIVGQEMKLRRQAVACVKEVNRRGIWKKDGYKSIQQFCRETLQYDDFEMRSMLIAAGVVITSSQMKDANPIVQKRINALIKWRQMKAERLNVPLYMIITNATLMAIAKRNPKTLEMMAEIPGIGKRKLDLFGREILSFTSA